jgi:hypothetical protein
VKLRKEMLLFGNGKRSICGIAHITKMTKGSLQTKITGQIFEFCQKGGGVKTPGELSENAIVSLKKN